MVAKKDFPTCINCKQPCLVDLLHGAGARAGAGASAGGSGGAAGDGGDKRRGNGK